MGIFAAIPSSRMHPKPEFIGPALPRAGSLRYRAILAAGAVVGLCSCGQSPLSTDKDSSRTTPPGGEERVANGPTNPDTRHPPMAGSTRDKPLTTEEVARLNRLE